MQPAEAATRRLAAAIVLLIAIRFVAGALLPLSADEAYYWLWSKHIAAGYFDHPPAIAFCIRAGTLLFGNTALGVRFVPILLSAVASLFVWRTGAILFGSEEKGAFAALAFNLTLMVGVEALAATPDAPEIAAAAAFLFALAKLEASGNPKWWLAAGIAAGVGLLSKYTALFLGAGAAAWLVFVRTQRRWLLSPWPYAGAVMAGTIFIPNLLWNASHGWITFAFQFGRVATGGFTLRYLFEFLGAQLALATPILFVLGVAGAIVSVRIPRLQLVAAMLAPAVLYFTVHSLHDRVQGNWPSFLFPAFAIAMAAGWTWRPEHARTTLRVARAVALPLAAAMLLLAYAQALFGIVPMGRADPLSRLLAVGFRPVAEKVAAEVRAAGAHAVITTDYASTAWLSFYGMSVPVIPVSEGYRWSMAPAVPRAVLAGPVIYVVESPKNQAALVSRLFSRVVPIADVDRRRGDVVIAHYEVYRVSGLRRDFDARAP